MIRVPCFECLTPVPAREARKGRCPSCWSRRVRQLNRSSPYQRPGWRRLAEVVRRRQGGLCAVCGSPHRVAAHHRIPRAEGGTDSLDNLIGLCNHCHSRYEADRRAGADTELRRIVEGL